MPYAVYEIVKAIVIMVASYLIAQAFAPKMQTPVPAAFEDLDFPQADEGTAQVVVFGDCWVEDWTVLALGNFRTTKIKRSTGK